MVVQRCGGRDKRGEQAPYLARTEQYDSPLQIESDVEGLAREFQTEAR